MTKKKLYAEAEKEASRIMFQRFKEENNIIDKPIDSKVERPPLSDDSDDYYNDDDELDTFDYSNGKMVRRSGTEDPIDEEILKKVEKSRAKLEAHLQQIKEKKI